MLTWARTRFSLVRTQYETLNLLALHAGRKPGPKTVLELVSRVRTLKGSNTSGGNSRAPAASIKKGLFASRTHPEFVLYRRSAADGEYLFQTTSGTKLATRIMKKAAQKRFQLSETKDSTFRTPTKATRGKPIPSIRQCTLPHDRAFIRHPTPAHPTESVHRLPAAVNDIAD